jgi:alpha-amylase
VKSKRVKTNSIYLGLLLSTLVACGTGSDAPPGSEAAAGASTSAGGSGAGGGAASGGGTGNAAGSSGAAASMAGQAGAAPLISGPPPAGGVFVHLFEWKWTDIAAECENYLGPAGFAGVQVSPPSEHTVLTGYPWWQRYQTVSYSLAQSRSGTAAEFADMVQRCARVGVGIYVDAVINHTTAQAAGVGSNGTKFTKYAYPDLYDTTNFHQPPCAIQGADYQDDPDHVRICELDSLADLRTEDDAVRDKIAAYLTSLTDLGVAGFRVDSGKHMYPADEDAIVARVNQHTGVGHAPFFFFEVIDSGTEAIHATDYLGVGMTGGQLASITDFQYRSLFDRFTDGGKISEFNTLAASQPALPSAQAVVFTTNHDTERAMDGSIMYQDGKAYDLATVFLLAWPYGYPSLMSSYAFDRVNGFNLGPPSDTIGHTNAIYAPGSDTPNCAPDPATAAIGTWVCQHRDPFIAPMLAFRKATVGAETISNWWDDAKDQIAFGRGAKGFVVINREGTDLTRAFTTSLPAGSYCDVYAGGLVNGACTGATVVVDATGMANITAPSNAAVVIHVGQKL